MAYLNTGEACNTRRGQKIRKQDSFFLSLRYVHLLNGVSACSNHESQHIQLSRVPDQDVLLRYESTRELYLAQAGIFGVQGEAAL